MAIPIDIGLDEDCIEWVQRKSNGNKRLEDLFTWVWSEFTSRRQKGVSCKTTQRYLGLWKYGIRFGIVDVQSRNCQLKVGVYYRPEISAEQKGIQHSPFPDWSSRGLYGITLWEKNLLIIDILEEGYKRIRLTEW